MSDMLSFRILLKEHCSREATTGSEHMFVVDGVDIAKEVDYLLQGGSNSKPRVLLMSSHGEVTAGLMFHGRNLFLVRGLIPVWRYIAALRCCDE